MNERGSRISLQEKHEIHRLMKDKKSDREIANHLQRSIHTVRKWRRRIQQRGLDSKVPHPGRPRQGPLSTYPNELRAWILHLRTTHPGWGPQTIRIELQQDRYWRKQTLPSRSRIAAFLKAEGLTRRYLKSSQIVQPDRQRPSLAHEEWELDAQVGVRVKGLGKVSFIHILDKASRLKIESTPLFRVHKPGRVHYMLALRRAFLHWGRPKRISFDRDTVFFDNTYPSPFPTMIHRWLVALGIEVVFTRRRRPTDHAQIERSHRTMIAQAVEGQTWHSLDSLWRQLDERRDILNRFMPCKALGGMSSYQAFPAAASSGRAYRLENEERLLSLARLYDYLSQGTWFRYSVKGMISLGGEKYWIGSHIKTTSFVIQFNPGMGVFEVRPESADGLMYIPPRGMSKLDLMGEWGQLDQLSAFQLPLPFLASDLSINQLAYLQTGTIL